VQGGGAFGGGHEGVFVPSTGSLFLPGFDPQAGEGGREGGRAGGRAGGRKGIHQSEAGRAINPSSFLFSSLPPSLPPSLPSLEMEGLGTYFCSGVKDRAEEERPLVTIKLAIDK